MSSFSSLSAMVLSIFNASMAGIDDVVSWLKACIFFLPTTSLSITISTGVVCDAACLGLHYIIE